LPAPKHHPRQNIFRYAGLPEGHGIPDSDGTLGKLYGQEWNLIKLGRMPALFIIDQKGTIAFAQYAKNMADIPDNKKLLQILEGNTQ